MWPQIDLEQLRKHYPGNYYGEIRSPSKGKIKERLKRETLSALLGYPFPPRLPRRLLSIFASKLQHYPHYVLSGRVLDIGCGQGFFLTALESLGWEAYGVDVDERAVSFCGRLGLSRVTKASAEEMSFPNDHFDAITMFHVLEHLHNPGAALEKAWSVLKPEGEVVITVPNTGSIAAKFFRSKWFPLEAPRHLFIFSKKSLEMLLIESGFKISSFRSSDFLGSLPASLPYVFASVRYSRLFQRLIYLAGLFVDPIGSMCFFGDQITVRARKRT